MWRPATGGPVDCETTYGSRIYQVPNAANASTTNAANELRSTAESTALVIGLKLRQLAIKLSKLPSHPCNSVELEQYQTEGDLAALWLAQIDAHDGLDGKTVLDLGAGNGILGHGAQLLGAEVTFVECDKDAAKLCEKLGPTITGRVGEIELPKVDIVITNPPWGVQTHGADRAFIDSCLLYTSPSPRDATLSRMPSSA